MLVCLCFVRRGQRTRIPDFCGITSIPSQLLSEESMPKRLVFVAYWMEPSLSYLGEHVYVL